jgi:hypothetical protein
LKNLYLFGLVSGSCGVCLGLGCALGFVIDGPVGSSVGGVAGGLVGVVTGSEIAHRSAVFEVPEWEKLIYIGPASGLGIGAMGPALFYNGDTGVLMALFGIVGSGFGALVAKYILRFFVHDPPPSIR